MTSNSDKIRSLFLAAIMVFSVFAMTTAFAGSAAAATTTAGNSSITPSSVAEETTNTHTVTLEADAVNTSGDGNQVFIVDLPDALGTSSTQVTNSAVNTGNVTVGSTNVNSNSDVIAVTLQDDSGVNSETVNVKFDITNVEAPRVDKNDFTAQAQFAVDANADGDLSDSEDSARTDFQQLTVTNVDSGTAGDETNLSSGETFFSGQDVRVENLTAGQDYQLRRADTDNNRAGTLVKSAQANADGVVTFTLDGNAGDGDYVLYRPGDNRNNAIVVNNGVAQDEGSTAGTPDISDALFEVVPQDLSVDVDDSEVGTSGNSALTDFDVQSNVRNDYSANISANGNLDTGELNDIFGENYNVVQNYSEADTIRVANVEGTREINFSGIDTGNYTFDVEVNDTSASASDSVEVVETGDQEASFAQSVVEEERGDVAEIPIQLQNTDTATVEIGDFESDNYNLTVEVEDGNSDGEVVLEFNTFSAGAVEGESNMDGGTVVSVADNDDSVTVQQENGSFSVNAREDIQSSFTKAGDTNTTTQKEVGERVLAATDYDVLVTANDGISHVENEDDVSTLSLSQRSTESATIHTAPSAKSDDISSVSDVNGYISDGNITQADTIADEDVAIVQVQASGLEGLFRYHVAQGLTNTSAYRAHSGDSTAPTPNAFVHSIEQQNAGANAETDGTNIANSAFDSAEVIVDGDNDTHYVVIPDAADALGAEDGDEFEANFTMVDNGDRSLSGDSVEVNDTFGIADRDATLNTDDSGNVTVQAASGQQISGTTNVAPGTRVTVRLRSSSSNSPFLLQPRGTVQADGTYTVTADFSQRSPGAQFTAQTRVQGSDLGDSEDGRIRSAPQASVSISDQESDGTTVTVDSAQLSAGGFVAIHNGSATGSVIGASDYLGEGSHENIEITLDEEQSGDFTAVAMPHLDTNNNEEYEFSGGSTDGPYTADGAAVTDSAAVTVAAGGEESPTPTATESPTPTEEPTDTPTATEQMTEMTTEEETTTGGSGPGFTAAIALIALVAAALLAVRRDN